MEMIAALQNTQTGIAFTMRLVRQGERYGRDNCLTHDRTEPLVEFYDTRHPFHTSPQGVVLGQFVSRYYAETLQESRSVSGLCLDGGVRDWYLDAEAFGLARALIRNWTGR